MSGQPPDIAQSTVLVTGAAGLVGSVLTERLIQKGFRVKALYHNARLQLKENERLIPLQGDLLDVVALEELMADVSKVYHCAGLVNFSAGNRNNLYKINVEATANVVNASIDAGVKKLVQVSSVAALGRRRKNETIHEGMNWSKETGNSVYAETKHLGEMEVWRGIAEGLDAVIVNPSVILGPGDWDKGSAAIFKSLYNEFRWYTEGVTGFVDVRDVADAMILLMESDVSAERFILSAENNSYKAVFDMIADEFSKKRPSSKVTPFIAEMVWRIEYIKSVFTGKTPLVTKETAATAMEKVYFDNSKLQKFFPEFTYRPIRETIQYACNAMKERYQLK